jgi:hypothetical protein
MWGKEKSPFYRLDKKLYNAKQRSHGFTVDKCLKEVKEEFEILNFDSNDVRNLDLFRTRI